MVTEIQRMEDDLNDCYHRFDGNLTELEDIDRLLKRDKHNQQLKLRFDSLRNEAVSLCRELTGFRDKLMKNIRNNNKKHVVDLSNSYNAKCQLFLTRMQRVIPSIQSNIRPPTPK